MIFHNVHMRGAFVFYEQKNANWDRTGTWNTPRTARTYMAFHLNEPWNDFERLFWCEKSSCKFHKNEQSDGYPIQLAFETPFYISKIAPYIVYLCGVPRVVSDQTMWAILFTKPTLVQVTSTVSLLMSSTTVGVSERRLAYSTNKRLQAKVNVSVLSQMSGVQK